MKSNGTYDPKKGKITYTQPPRTGEMLAAHISSDPEGVSAHNQNLADKKGMAGAREVLFGPCVKKN
jgi:hypothetical protein